MAGFEASLATHLVGVRTSVPAILREFGVRDGFVDACKRLLTARSTWTSVVVVLSKFVLGLAYFVALVTAGALGSALLAAPFVYDDPTASVGFVGTVPAGQYSIGPWIVDTLPEALGVAAGGVVFLLVAVNLLNTLARLQAHYTKTLLESGADSA